MFTALYVTKYILKAMYSLGVDDVKYFGVEKPRRQIKFVQNRVKFFVISGVLILACVVCLIVNKAASGKKRLRKVAKECQNYGQRVQNSVFECIMDNAKTKVVKAKLLEIIDMDKDSLRFYYLGNAYKNKVEHYGTRTSIDLEGTLII